MFGVVRLGRRAVWALAGGLLAAAVLGGAALWGQAEQALAPRDGSRVVYLTFDDGPSDNTTAILEALAEYGIRATFFATGQYEGDSAGLLQRIAAEGHSIGLHSFSHNYEEIYSCSEAFFADLQKVDELVEQATGQQAVLYRFPGGSTNSHCPKWLRSQLRQQLADRGYIYHDWNVVSGDQGSRVLPVEELVQNVTEGAARVGQRPLVVLFHDTNHCQTTPEAVRLVAEQFLEEGWQFCPLTPETAPIRL